MSVKNQTTRLELADGEEAVFGYGSLLSIQSLEGTLRRSYSGPFMACAISDWRRRWNIGMPNDRFATMEDSGWIWPDTIVYLNVEPAPKVELNGCLFVVSRPELDLLDARESIYVRLDVSSSLRGVSLEGGRAWLYVGKPEFEVPVLGNWRQAAIRASYLAMIEKGLSELGPDFRKGYLESTDDFPQEVVIRDERVSR